jgi:sialic acid synthase
MTHKTPSFQKPKVIAEIGCNHMGDFEIAKELIQLAKKSGASFVKFQKRNNKELLTEQQYNTPHPVPENSFGVTYGLHREYLEFSIEQHFDLFNFCKKNDILYSTSVWDCTSAREIIKLCPAFIKVPSACNNNFDLLKILRDEYDGQVHISVGMTYNSEIEDLVKYFEETKSAKDRLVIYACTSGYPVPAQDVSLLEICRLKEIYMSRVFEFGFSGHHLGIAIDIAAYTLGVSWIERHFTKNRAWKGTDHAASLEPQGLEKLVRDLNIVKQALTFKNSEILEIEFIQREKLKYKK